MTIVGNTDDRTIITGQELNADPYDSVVAIDNSATFTQPPGVGSGIIIGSNHVLTAAHVALNNGLIPSGVRITLPEEVATLNPRTVTPVPANDHNVVVTGKGTDDFLPAPSYVPGITDKNDVGRLEIAENYSIADSSRYMGIVAYVNPLDAVESDVYTAGYPAAVRTPYLGLSTNAQFLIRNEDGGLIRRNIPGIGSVNLTDARTMFAATGKIESVNSINGLYTLSETIESESGQSGSGLWTFLEGDLEPRVVDIVNSSFETVDFGNGSQASPITTDVYKNIITEIGSVNGIDDASVLPENAIVGSNVADNIEGTYRRERILGNEGKDIISGGDADDRLEGGIGNDVLKGEKGNDRLQGDEGNDDLDGGEGNIDVAVFSDEYTTENYSYSISEDGEEITISHIGGTRNDGVDTLKNIEWALFENGAENIDNLPINSANTETETISQVASATGSAPRPASTPTPRRRSRRNSFPTSLCRTTHRLHPRPRNPPPYLSLTAPVSMLDGDIDYTVSVTPYKPDSENNLIYIMKFLNKTINLTRKN